MDSDCVFISGFVSNHQLAGEASFLFLGPCVHFLTVHLSTQHVARCLWSDFALPLLVAYITPSPNHCWSGGYFLEVHMGLKSCLWIFWVCLFYGVIVWIMIPHSICMWRSGHLLEAFFFLGWFAWGSGCGLAIVAICKPSVMLALWICEAERLFCLLDFCVCVLMIGCVCCVPVMCDVVRLCI